MVMSASARYRARVMEGSPRAAVRLTRRGDRKLEPVWILHPEHACAPRRVGWLRLERAAGVLDALGDLVDVLHRRYLKRETLSLHAIPSLGAIVLPEENAHAPGFQRGSPHLALALVRLVDREA